MGARVQSGRARDARARPRRAFAAAALLALAGVAGCRPVPRGDVVPAFAPGADAACPEIDRISVSGSLEAEVLGHPCLVNARTATLKVFVDEKTIEVSTTLATVSAVGADAGTLCVVGCRRAKQVLVLFRDLDGDGVAAEFAGERVLEAKGRAYGVDWDAKRGAAYVYVSGARGARILRLKDDDGDGVPDREETFVDGEKFPSLLADGRDLWVQADGEVVVATWAGCVVQSFDRVTAAYDGDGDGAPETVETYTADEFDARPPRRR